MSSTLPNEVLHDPTDYPYNVITDIYFLVVCTIGAVLSGSILAAIFKRRWRKASIDEKLSAYMLIFDFAIAIFEIISSSFNLAGKLYLVEYRELCNFDALLTFLLYGVSINLVGLISFERCLIVVFQRRLSNTFYHCIAALFVAIPIIVSIIGWVFDGMSVRPMAIYCMFDYNTSVGRWITVPAIIYMALSQTFTLVGYVLIALHRRKTSRKTQLELGLDPKTVEDEVNRTICRSMIIVCFNTFTLIPHTVIFFFSLLAPEWLSAPLEMAASMLLSSNCITNSAILLYMKPELIKRSKAVWGF